MNDAINVRPATDAEATDWRERFKEQAEIWYGGHGVPDFAERRLPAWEAAGGELLTVMAPTGTAAGVPAAIGSLALLRREARAVIFDLWIEPGQRGRGYGRAALRAAESWAGPQATSISADLWTADPAAGALFADYSLRAQRMIKKLGPVELPPGITARPLSSEEFVDWKANEVTGYAEDLARSGASPESDSVAAAQRSFDELLPDGPDTADNSLWAVSADGERVATIWLAHHTSPEVSFVFSVEVHPQFRGRGYGRATMLVGEQKSAAAGDRHLALNVFGHNPVAIGLYDSLGYALLNWTLTLDLPHSGTPGN